LLDVVPNCVSPGVGPREVVIVSGATVALDVAVECSTATRIAFTVAGLAGNSEIYTVRSNGLGTTRLTDHPAADKEPTWSPDGTRIAFTSDRDGPHGIHVMNADGTNQHRLTDWPGLDTEPAWSPDGTKIAFSSERDGKAEIYVMRADGSNITRITTNNTWDGQPDWSPDGSRLAFTRTVCNATRDGLCYPAVIVTTATGQSPQEVDVGEEPVWSPHGRSIAVTRFTCDFFYSYSNPPCTVAGIGIVNAFPVSNLWYGVTWERELTTGAHANPTWQR